MARYKFLFVSHCIVIDYDYHHTTYKTVILWIEVQVTYRSPSTLRQMVKATDVLDVTAKYVRGGAHHGQLKVRHYYDRGGMT